MKRALPGFSDWRDRTDRQPGGGGADRGHSRARLHDSVGRAVPHHRRRCHGILVIAAIALRWSS
jgi:hypothetical protein